MPDVFLYLPDNLAQRASSDQSTDTTYPSKLNLLYFITGNPGLIDYYVPFLTLLTQGHGKEFVIASASLAGFEARSDLSDTTPTEDAKDDLLPLFPDGFARKEVYNLRDQIEICYLRITTLVARLHGMVEGKTSSTEVPTPMSVEVILAGHSVGAYIALEIVRRHHEASITIGARPLEIQESDVVSSLNASDQIPPWNIASTFLLTPTIENIAHSRWGRIATPVLSSLPGFPYLVQLGASSLRATLPTTWLRGLVEGVTGMRNGDMVGATTTFLRRPGAVRQALYLASCEMTEIGQGKWTDAVWGAAKVPTDELGKGSASLTRYRKWRAPIHYMLFAKEDHWIADGTREAIVASMNGVSEIKVDDGELGLVHAWCLEQNALVAKIVDGWMEQVVEGNESNCS